ncbi:hypothetical protein HNR61_007868 [Actinomadura namibiensis]|uniref:Uncharacterized protein n=1 Tax=Actinomadura namibiensis TaxID=182080 RepID=A0A7W3QR05_ACTNM|nr:hypothetical protein [Actinomadura namibiensis]
MLADDGSASPCRMEVRLGPWSEPALALLRRTDTPETPRHLGGPEPEDEPPARRDVLGTDPPRAKSRRGVDGWGLAIA